MTAPATASDRITAAFGSHGKRAALMPYLMGGFPDLDSSREIGLACADAGADLLELGIPFSDPLADGPVIHAAATAALAAGATPGEVLRVCEELAPRLPVVLMVYANLVLARGAGAFVDRAAAAGAAGLIVPDLPHDESAEALAACDAAGIALVPLAAPSTPPGRLLEIGRDARGFVYTTASSWAAGWCARRGRAAPRRSGTRSRSLPRRSPSPRRPLRYVTRSDGRQKGAGRPCPCHRPGFGVHGTPWAGRYRRHCPDLCPGEGSRSGR